jgi:hypothetical protein
MWVAVNLECQPAVNGRVLDGCQGTCDVEWLWDWSIHAVCTAAMELDAQGSLLHAIDCNHRKYSAPARSARLRTFSAFSSFARFAQSRQWPCAVSLACPSVQRQVPVTGHTHIMQQHLPDSGVCAEPFFARLLVSLTWQTTGTDGTAHMHTHTGTST